MIRADCRQGMESVSSSDDLRAENNTALSSTNPCPIETSSLIVTIMVLSL